MTYLWLRAGVVLSVVALCHGSLNDATLREGTFGTEIVNSVITRIRTTGIWTTDRQFLRRLALVLTCDGQDESTYTSNGGIWQVSLAMFQATQNCTDPAISSACTLISTTLHIQWTSVTWTDLKKPLYSGLAATLFSLLQLGTSTMPAHVNGQASLCLAWYSVQVDVFVTIVTNYEVEIDCNDQMDLVFVLDGSGSVSYWNYQKMLNFTVDVVNVLHVSPTQTQVATVVYGTHVWVHFHLDDHGNKANVTKALMNSPKLYRGTSTDLALDKAREVLVDSARGARQGVKKVAILVTDGWSRSLNKTVTAAQALKDIGVTVLAVGVGNFNPIELNQVATAPATTHFFPLTNFAQLPDVLDDLRRSTCEANYVVGVNASFHWQVTEVFSQITVETVVTSSTQVLELSTTCGLLNVYMSTLEVKPGPHCFDDLVVVTPGHSAVLTRGVTVGSSVYVTVVGTRLSTCSDFSWTLTWVPAVTVTCSVGGIEQPCTPSDIAATGLCPADVTYEIDNPCSSDSEGQIHRHPFDPRKYLQCDEDGNFVTISCPGTSFFNTRTLTCGFVSIGTAAVTCPVENPSSNFPCTKHNIARQLFYHPYPPDNKKFIQCDEWGTKFIRPCAPGTEWNQTALTCVHTTSCTQGAFRADPCDYTKYFQCSHGHWLEMACSPGLHFDPSISTCGWPQNPMTPYPASCTPPPSAISRK